MSVGVISPRTTWVTASTMGISTPTRCARSRTDSHDFTPSATCRVDATISATDRPRPSFSPNVRLRDSGEEQVATRSPSPASPEKVYGSAPSAPPSRAVSGESSGDHTGFRVVTETQALGHSDSESDDVLDGSTELGADHICVRVGAEVRRVARLLDLLRPLLVEARDHAGGGLPFRDLSSEVRTRDDGDPLGRCAGDFGDDFAHPLGGAQLDAFHQADEGNIGREDWRP